MKNRIDECFSNLKKAGHKALVGYLTAGYPDMEKSEADIRTVLSHGVDILEAGVPFSDPTADGSVIRAAGRCALESGANLKKIIEMLSRVRRDYTAPIILFSYANPLFSYGYEALCDDAASAGIDGLLAVDVPFEESGQLQKMLAGRGLHYIRLVAPTTTPDRMKRILRHAEGFVYYVMVKGITGVRQDLGTDVESQISLIRKCTRTPVAAGFGVGNGAQAREVGKWADAVVVGSALVKAAEEGRLPELTRELSDALRS